MAHHDHDPHHDPLHHGHSHDDPLHLHPDSPIDIDALDPANRSLAEALRISFGMLKLAMALLVVAFVFSGTRNVNEGHAAVRLLFGSVYGEPGRQVLERGGPYVWPPAPIGRFIDIPLAQQQLTLDEAFWFELAPAEHGKPLDQLRVRGSLRPGIDSALLTGDKNIVHVRWTVNWRVDKLNAVDFARHVSAFDDTTQMLARGGQLVRQAAEAAIVHAVAGVTADDLMRGQINRAAVRRDIQQRLDALRVGITVGDVLLQQPTPPLAALGAFKAVSEAESEKARKIDAARKEATNTLTSVAGDGYGALLDAVEAYEQARRAGNPQQIDQAERRLNDLLAGPMVGGQVSETISRARAYQSGAQKLIEGEVDAFAQLYPQYNRNRRIFLNRLWTDTLQTILAGDVETFYLPSDPSKDLYFVFNRDPRVQRQRQVKAFTEQQTPPQQE